MDVKKWFSLFEGDDDVDATIKFYIEKSMSIRHTKGTLIYIFDNIYYLNLV